MKSQKAAFEWEGGAYGKLVETSLEKNEKKRLGKKATPERIRLILFDLDYHIKNWRAQFKRFLLLRPDEHSKIIKRINCNAKELLRDIKALGLPIYSFRYFADEAVAGRHADLFRPLNIEWDVKAIELKEHMEYFTWGQYLPVSEAHRDILLKRLTDEGIHEQLKEYMEFFDWALPISEVRVDLLLEKLTDSERLHEIAANKPLLTKTKIAQPEVTYIIRNLGILFKRRYGKPLPITILNICLGIYPNSDLNYDRVRSKLKDFDLT